MGKTLRPRKFSAPPKQKDCKKSAGVDNSKHVRLGLHASALKTRTFKPVPLRRFKQPWTFATVSTWTTEQRRRFLLQQGVLPAKNEVKRCWQCGSEMTIADGRALHKKTLKSISISTSITCLLAVLFLRRLELQGKFDRQGGKVPKVPNEISPPTGAAASASRLQSFLGRSN